MTHEEHIQLEAPTLGDIAIAIDDGRLPAQIDGADYALKVGDLRLLRRATQSTRASDELNQPRPLNSSERLGNLGLDPSGF